MQTVNPTHVAAAKPKGTAIAAPTYKFPVQVVCVVRTLEDANMETIQAVRKFAQEEKVNFETRLYDSIKYRHDRDEISSLPAFHIYMKGRYEKTFYPNGRPFQIIDDYITLYLEEQRLLWEKKHRWTAFWKGVKAKLKRLLKRETRLERAERERHEHAARAQQRLSFDGRGRAVSMLDWE